MRRMLLCWLVLVNFSYAPPLHAADPSTTREEALQQFTETLYGRTPLSGRSVYQTMYWFWAVAETGLGPDEALTSAAERTKHTLPEIVRRQLLADWRIASENGLLTSSNLASMRQNSAPYATAGPYNGQRFDVAKIIPQGDNDVSNLMFSVTGRPPLFGAVADRSYSAPQTTLLSKLSPAAPAGTPDGNTLAHPPAFTPSPVSSATVSANTAGGAKMHIDLLDLPLNGLLLIGDQAKIGIAGINGNEIEVSIVGEKQVYVNYSPQDRSRGGYLPSVRRFKVPKTSPVHLPNVSSNAYLLLNLPTVQFYYVDTTVNNGAGFRIAKVTPAP